MHTTLGQSRPLRRLTSMLLAGLALYASCRCHALERSARSGVILQTWSSEDGLVAGNIYALARSPDGFLWLGTDSGLIRYDGERFVTEETKQFPIGGDDTVSCLFVDRQGSLWAGTARGHLLSSAQGIFHEIQLPPQARGHLLHTLAEDQKGGLWAAVSGVGIICSSNGNWRVFGVTNGLPSNDATYVLCDSEDRIWAVSSGRLLGWQNGEWRPPTNQIPSNQAVTAIGAGAEGSLWVATTAEVNFRGAHLFRLSQGQWLEDLPPYPWPQDSMRSSIKALVEDKSGRLWVSTTGGGVFQSQRDGKWQPLRQGPLAFGLVNALLLDQEDTLWFGLEAGQLCQAYPQAVIAIRPQVPDEQNIVQSVCARRDGTIWAGTYGAGVFCFLDGKWTRYAADQGLTNLYVFSIYEDSQSNLWVGSRSGLYQFTGGRYELSTDYPQSLPVLSLFESREGTLWLGSNQNVWRLKPGAPKRFGAEQGITPPDDVRALAQDSAGMIWAAVRRVGLFRQISEDRFQQYQPQPWRAGVDIRAMLFDAEGSLWLATYGQGLFRIKAGQSRQWTVRDGLPSNYCVGLVEDQQGRLWISTLNGVFGCTSKEFEALGQGHKFLTGRHLSQAEGLDVSACSGWGQPVAARGADGRLWFPNQRAIAAFDPAKVVSERGTTWPVAVEGLRVDGVSTPIGPNNDASIQSGFRQVEIHYTLPDLLAPGRLRFRYRLQGLEDEWNDAQQRRSAYYGHLRPGHYEFLVMASGPAGIWQQSRLPLLLEVLPRWWERPITRAVAVTLVLAGVAATVWFVSRVRFRRKLLQLEAHQSAEQERRRIARDLHDELGSGLTEIMLLGDLGGTEGASAQDARGTAATVAQKARQLAAALDEIVWTTNPRNDALPRLTGYICDYAQQFLSATSIRCRLDVGAIPEQARVSATSRHNLLLACKEALRNAVRHSGAEEIWVRVSSDDGHLRLAIEDNGRGFDTAGHSSRGNGLNNMRERLEGIGRVDIRSQLGHGTSVAFELALGA